MDLYLIRHADAVPRGSGGFDDWSRPLTDAGQDQARRLGEWLKRLQVRLDAVVTSPLVRARQTTEVFVPQLAEPQPAIEVFDGLGEDMRPRRVARYLEQLRQRSVALVGHEPAMSEFLAWLIGSKKARLELAKAGAAHVDCESFGKGGGTL